MTDCGFERGRTFTSMEAYREHVAQAAGLLLVQAVSGNSDFVLIVVAKPGSDENAKIATSVATSRDVSVILDEAARAARKEWTDEDPD